MNTTISDIARLANVPAMTVSRVTNGGGPIKKETAERIRQLIIEPNYTPNLIARRNLLDGLILIKATPGDNRLKPLFESGFPAMADNFKQENASCNFVDSENIRGARLTVRYLYEKGYRKTGFMKGFMAEGDMWRFSMRRSYPAASIFTA
ncbi:MAG TPA: LacI family transcriptional regulator [Calditrichaeota bacterium]|nr:LacI family transcriptional regulator [Calditrichota bacterium]